MKKTQWRQLKGFIIWCIRKCCAERNENFCIVLKSTSAIAKFLSGGSSKCSCWFEMLAPAAVLFAPLLSVDVLVISRSCVGWCDPFAAQCTGSTCQQRQFLLKLLARPPVFQMRYNRGNYLQLQSRIRQLRRRTATSSGWDAVRFRKLNFTVARFDMLVCKWKICFKRLKKSHYDDLYCISLHKKLWNAYYANDTNKSFIIH